MWNILEKKDEIYLSKYSGWYSVSDEAFYSDDEIKDENGNKTSLTSGSSVEWVEEESYFFRLSKWEKPLLKFYSENPDFILNQEPYRSAEIIVAGDNFGCGSSREHAPWALTDFGIRCVISTSFGDIFYNNSMKNGLVPIRVSREELDALMADAKDAENPELSIDLEKQEIQRPNGGVIKFDFDEFRRHCLLNGLDDIGLTLQKDDAIGAFEGERWKSMEWLGRGTGV